MRTAIAERGERIGGLARLRDEERRASLVERRLAIAELRGDIDIDRQPRPALEPVFGDEAGIEGGAAGREREPGELGEIEGKSRDVDAVGGKIDIGRERVADHFRLLMDLLGHEVAVVALVDQKSRGERAGDRPLHRLAVAVADGDAFPRQHRPIAVFEIGDRIGEGGERDRVGADEHLAVAVADGERAPLARHDHQIVVAAEDDGERKRALEALQRVEDGAHRIAAGSELAGDEMSDDLGVGVAGEHRPFRRQFFLQLTEILDDAVMHDRDEIGHMRMRVGFDRLAVGRPARVADAGLAVERRSFEKFLEIAQLAFGAPAAELAILDGGDAGGIVAAIFKALQRVDKLFGNGPFAEYANNAAHRPLLPRALATS